MKFALILEAVDKASKAIKAVSGAQKAAGKQSVKSAEAAARAQEKATKTQDAANRAAEAAVKTAGKERRGILAKAAALLKLNKVTGKYKKLQEALNRRGLDRLRGGYGKAVGGLKGAGGKALALSAIGTGAQGGAAALFWKPAKQYSQMKEQLEAVTKSAEAADKALEWIQARQMPPHGIMDLTAGFVALRTAGVDPTRGALQAAADAAAAQHKSVADVTTAMQAAFQGDYEALNEIGIKAEKQGKYISYVFKDKEGRLKRIRALSGNIGAQGAAMAEAMRRAHGGASEKAGQTWEGMTKRVADMFDRIRIRIMSGGLYKFIQEKIKFVNGELDKFLKQIEVWANNGVLQDKIDRITKKAERCFTIAWKVALRLYHGAERLYWILDKISGITGGWQNLLMALIAVPFIPYIISIASGLMMMARGFLGLIAFAAPLGSLFKVLLVGLRMAAFAFIRLGIAMMTTPIGWIIAGIAAVAAAAYLIYRNWDKIGPYFTRLWNWVKGIFTGFWNWLKGFFSAGNIGSVLLAAFMPVIGLPLLIYQNWDKVTPYFAALWGGVKNICGAFWEWLKGIISWETIAGNFSALAAGASQAFSGLWDSVKTEASAAWDWLVNLFDWEHIKPAFDGLKDGIIGVFKAIWDYAGGIFDKISNAWKSIKGWFGGGNVAEAASNAERAAQSAAAGRVPPQPAAIMPAEQKPASGGIPAAPVKGGDVSISFAPNISIQGAEPSAVKKAIDDIYAQFKRELPRLMEEANRRRERLAY